MTGYASHADWHERAPEYSGVPRQVRLSGKSGVVLARIEQPAGFYRKPPIPSLNLQLVLSGPNLARIDHGDRFEARAVPRHLALAPADTSTAYDVAGNLLVLVADLPLKLLRDEEASDGAPLDFGPLHAGLFHDQAVTEIVMRLWDSAGCGAEHSALLADHAWLTIVQLLRDTARQPRPRTSAKADRRLRRAVEILEAHLGEDMGLIELAQSVGLSPRHLTTLFRTHIGETPHRYLMRRRVERASEMLVDARSSITDIAYACGFASSQHLATAFRRRTGLTPTAYRRERLR